MEGQLELELTNIFTMYNRDSKVGSTVVTTSSVGRA